MNTRIERFLQACTPRGQDVWKGQNNGYEAGERSLLDIVGCFSLVLGSVLGTILAVSVYVRPSISRSDQLGVLWFALCKNFKLDEDTTTADEPGQPVSCIAFLKATLL